MTLLKNYLVCLSGEPSLSDETNVFKTYQFIIKYQPKDSKNNFYQELAE